MTVVMLFSLLYVICNDFINKCKMDYPFLQLRRRATAEELGDVLSANGNIIKTLSIDYKRNAMSGMKWTNEWLREAEEQNREFLFLIEKT